MKWFLSLFRGRRKARQENGLPKADDHRRHHINVHLHYGNDKDIGYC